MSNRTPKEALREIRNRIVYMYGNIDGTFNPPALKEVCEIADDAISSPITEKSSAVGNAAALREALLLCYRIIHCAMVAGVINRDDANKAMDAYHAALTAPARNCDVGTAEEQQERFDKMCFPLLERGMCKNCRLYNTQGSCELAWAQTPYEAQEGAGE